jgi:GR25 family glycosyltransferase involved in LPS biosynthesis
MKLFHFMMIACCFFLSISHANVQDYLKKAKDKSGFHNMRNIDFIYMINLDQRPEKFEKSAKQLACYGIYPYRFSAVNGWELSLEAINDLGVKFAPGMKGGFMGTSYLPNGNFTPHHEIIQNYGQTYFSHCMSRGAIGIVLSHLSILQDAYDSGYETIWIMEDDILVVEDPRLISDLIGRLDKIVGKENWDIFFTDRDTFNNNGENVPCTTAARRLNFELQNKKRFKERYKVDRNLRYLGARYGAYSMIVRRSGMKKILNFIKKHNIFLPYDMDFYLPEDIHMYSVLSDIVTAQTKAASDNGAPNYLNKE